MEMGADDYISKPFDGTELLNAIDSRLKKAEMQQREVTPIATEQMSNKPDYVYVDPIQSLTEYRSINKYKKKQNKEKV